MKRKILAVIAITLMGLVGIVGSNEVFAVKCPAGSARAGQEVDSVARCNMGTSSDNHDGDNLMNTVQLIINVALGILGFLTVAVIIIGGYQYTTSTGDAGKVTKAKNTIMYGIIGLVIALLAFAIVNFVLSSVFGNKNNKSEGGGSESSETSGVLIQTIKR